MFFTVVLRVTEKRFIADAAIMDSMVQLQRKKAKGDKKRGCLLYTSDAADE